MSRFRFPKSLFIFSSSFSSSSSSSSSSVRPLLLQISHFSNSSGYPSYARRHDDDSRNVPVSVWWDFENCNLPADVNVFRIVHCITEAVRAKGIKGPLQITAFGDVFRLTRAKQEALTSTGINLTHIPNGGKNSADRSLLVDLMYWVSQNPPPAHLFLISGDRDFAGILHRLRMNNYNILLACPERPPNVLCSAATIMWHWNSLLKGENLPGKHFNHPPDGPFGSWYGHHKVHLDNPFSDGEQSTGSHIEEISDPASDLKLRPIPKATLRQIKHILYSNPEGISVSDLRAELAKADIHLDKDYYGYRKFSRFLLSMASVRCQVRGDGQLFVHCVTQKSPEPFDRSLVPSTTSVDNEELNFLATSKLSGEGENMVKDEAQTPPMASSHELGMEDVPEKAQQAVDVAKAQVTENQLSPKENQILSSGDVSQSVPERHEASESYNAEQSYAAVEKNGITNDSLVKLKPEDKYVKSTRKEADADCHTPYSSPLGESVNGKQIGGSTETYSNKLDKRPTFFGWIKSQWPFRRSDGNSDDLIAHLNKMAQNTGEPKLSKPNLTVNSEEPMLRDMKQTASHSEEPELSNLKQMVSPTEEPELSELKQTVNHTGKPELFSSSSFWSDMESFVFTRKGSILVSRSRSRKDMMQNFQRFGPMVLRSLSEDDLLQLVDLLISEKKWLEERPSQTFPFRLTPPVGKSSVGLSHGANGLRSLFLSSTTQSNLQKSSEGDLDKKYQSTSHTGVSPPEIKHTDRSRTDVLADIQKLVSEILREHSEGYNMGGIPRLFLERYGYPLDLQKLGYHKLLHLLQTLPRVKIESTYLFPTDHTNPSDAAVYSESELSDSNSKDDRKDSPWEELGPVSIGNSNLRDPESKVRQKAVELDTSIHPDYESSLSDDDYSESEGDSSSLTRAEGEGKPKHGVEDSSLLQTLESWYSNQGEDSAKSNNADTTCSGMTDGLNPSRQSTSGSHSKIHAGEYKEKRKPLKSYSFVADSVSQKKDELIDGILQSLKKSDDLKMQN